MFDEDRSNPMRSDQSVLHVLNPMRSDQSVLHVLAVSRFGLAVRR